MNGEENETRFFGGLVLPYYKDQQTSNVLKQQCSKVLKEISKIQDLQFSINLIK